MPSSVELRLESLIASCRRCPAVDKPYTKHHVYRWLPSRVRVLAIGESPPPGRKENMFYNLEAFDRLRLSMKLILNLKGDLEVLQTLRKASTFITAAVKCRPPSVRNLAEMRAKCVFMLEEELKLLRPSRVVAMGRMAAASLSQILNLNQPPTVRGVFELRVGSLQAAFTPHPNYIFRFRRDLAPKVRSLLLNGNL